MLGTIKGSLSLLSRRQKLAVTFLAVATLFVNALDIVAIFLLSVVGSLAIGGGQMVQLAWIPELDQNTMIVALLLVTAVIFAAKTVAGILLTRVRQSFLAKLEVHFSKLIAHSVFSGGLGVMKKHSRSYFEWSILRSTGIAFGSVVGQSLQLFAEATLAVFILGLFFYTDWLSATVVLVYFLAVILLFQLVTRAKSSATGSDFAEGSITVGQAITDTLVAFREISVLARIDYFLDRISVARGRVAHAQALQTTLQAIPRLIVEMALITGAIGFAAFQFARTDGNPDLGLISIFIVGSLRMMSALLPLYRAYMQLHYDGPQAKSSQGFVRDAIAANSKGPMALDYRDQAIELFSSAPPRAPSVELEDVSFHFEDGSGQEDVLKNVTLQIDSGATVALIGPSGAGKSTLVDLILGLYEPTLGRVLINGMKPQRTRDLLPGFMSYVPQKPGLISGTMRENIALGLRRDEVDEVALADAIRLAQIENLVETLPEGLDSNLGEQNDALSGGQIQRVGLARALYTRPRLLVLDEATSALDAETEATITQSLYSLSWSMTRIVVAHRLSTVKHADVVFVVDRGEIVASGKLKDLEKEIPLVKKYISLMSLDD